MVIPQLSSATEQVVRTRRLPKKFNDLMWILVVCEADASHGSFYKYNLVDRSVQGKVTF